MAGKWPRPIEFRQELRARHQRVVGANTLQQPSTVRPTPNTGTGPAIWSHPQRLLVGHPVQSTASDPAGRGGAGEKTNDPNAADDAVAFYSALGKAPRVLGKEMPGFVANRPQRAIFRECC